MSMQNEPSVNSGQTAHMSEGSFSNIAIDSLCTHKNRFMAE